MTATLKIDQSWLDQNTIKDSRSARIANYTGRSGNGMFRTLQTVDRTARVAKEAFGSLSQTMTEFQGKVFTGSCAMALPRLYDVGREAYQSAAKVVYPTEKDQEISLARRSIKAVRDGLEATSTIGYVAQFIKFTPVVGNVVRVVDLAADCTDLYVSREDYTKAAEFEAKTTGEVKEAFAHSRRYYLSRIVKAVVGIALTIIGVIGFYLNPLLWSVISLAATAIAIFRDLYKDEGKYKVIDFDRTVIV